jgi:hypothetical protein
MFPATEETKSRINIDVQRHEKIQDLDLNRYMRKADGPAKA